MNAVDAELVSRVQFNCDLSDARFAGNYTMCIYLLKMREYYRWRHGLPFGEALPMKAVGDWVQRTESHWDEIEARDFQPLPVKGAFVDVFDEAAVNAGLDRTGLVFSSGIGRFGKPVFFLGELVESRVDPPLTIYLSGREYARELSAPPAMTRGSRIFVRRESLARMLWEAVEEWRWQRRPGAMQRVVEHYGFDADPDAALAALLDDQVELVLLHEKGEHLAGRVLDDGYDAMLDSVAGTAGEHVVRGVRDCLADCLSVLPAIVAASRPELFHGYIALMTPLRRQLMPAVVRAWREWDGEGSPGTLADVLQGARDHFAAAVDAMTTGHRDTGRVDNDLDDLAY